MSYSETLNAPGPWAWDVDGRRTWRRNRRMRRMIAMTQAGDSTPAPAAPDEDAEPVPNERRGRGGPRRRHGGPGSGPWGRGPWGPPRGRRRERGDVRAAILLLLAEQPRHGYEIITEVADRSDGQWQPSPGSIYPVLKRLARDGLVEAEHRDGKRIFSLTDGGRTLVAEEGASWGQPWSQSASPGDEAALQLWSEGKQLGAAVWQVSQLNDAAQIKAATEILAAARKQVYALLAQ